MSELLFELPYRSADLFANREALKDSNTSLTYAEFVARCEGFARGLLALPVERLDRVAVLLDKRVETIVAVIGTGRAGNVFVPVNPLLKPAQCSHILRDCAVRVLITTADRYRLLQEALEGCPELQWVILTDPVSEELPRLRHMRLMSLSEFVGAAPAPRRPSTAIDADMAAILYTSGSTGQPKGVVLSHRNLVTGARSVASYLRNSCDDRILALLPLSFDYGLSQLTTAFAVGAAAVLHNYLFAADAVRLIGREQITGLAAVPPLWMQLLAIEWPMQFADHVRYFTNSGGAMPMPVLQELRRRLPRAEPYLMYGLTEAFRSSYLPPEEVDRIPGSIGKAIPNAELMVVREDGTECGVDEPGELVHRGSLVSMGYWNDPVKTAERFRPVPGQRSELVLTEMAVWSGDTVRRDADGFLYFVGRKDEMIKTSGYRVSPTEIEEAIYQTGLAVEAAAFGVTHPALGQAIAAVIWAGEGRDADSSQVLNALRRSLPAFMVPLRIDVHGGALPRNPNGKIDRKLLSLERQHLFEGLQ